MFLPPRRCLTGYGGQPHEGFTTMRRTGSQAAFGVAFVTIILLIKLSILAAVFDWI